MESSKKQRNAAGKRDFVPHNRISSVTTADNKSSNKKPAASGPDYLKPPPPHYHRSHHSSDGSNSRPTSNHTHKSNSSSSTTGSSKVVKHDKHDKQDRHDKQVRHDRNDKQNKNDKQDRHDKQDKHDKNDKQDKRDKHDSSQSNSTSSKKKNSSKHEDKQSRSSSSKEKKEAKYDEKNGKFPIRRCASVDVAELNRKKKSGKKRKKQEREQLLLQVRDAHQKEEQKKRSGSIGNRPTSLKLNQQDANAQIFPTPMPVKRHSSSTQKLDSEKHVAPSKHIASSAPIDNSETALILSSKSKRKLSNNFKEVTVDISDSEEPYGSTFPTGEGYRKHGLKLHFPSSPFFRLKPPVIRKLWVRILGCVLYGIVAFFLFCPSVAMFLVLFPVCWLLRSFFNCFCVCCCTRSQGEACVCCVCGQRLSLIEKFWYRNEIYGPQVVQSLVIIEYGLSLPQIVNLINTRLVLARGEDDDERLYPRFSQKVVQTCSDLVWHEDREFFIHNHVFQMPKGLESLEDLQEYVSDMASRGLSFEGPLWEVQVLTDFGDIRDTVLLFRMHPCVSDGVSMVKILYKSIADVEPVTTVPALLGQDSCMDTIRSYFYGPMMVLSKFLCTRADFNMLHGNHIILSGKKVITWSEPFSLASATRIKQVTRSTLNEVLMSVAAGCIRNYLIYNGIPHPYDLKSSIPVYFGTNKHASGIGNDVMMLNVSLPTNTEGVVPRLWQVKERMTNVRSTSLFSLTRKVLKFSHHMLTESLWPRVWMCLMNQCSCIVSSLSGPEICLRLSSRQIKTIFYWFPPIHKVALAISFFSYGDRIQMAVSSDRSVMPNPEIITRDFIFQMQDLYDQLAHRRIPGEHINKKVDLVLLNNEIRPEETAEQIQKKMSMVHQELQNLKHKLDSKRYGENDQDHKILKKIENLKEQFRELLVEMRQRKAAEAELAISMSEEDSTEDDDDFEMTRRPFRRRAMSVSSRLSTSSVSSTFRPLTASTTPAATPDFSPDSPLLIDKQVPYTSYQGDRKFLTTGPYANYRSSRREVREEFEILDYQYSPSLERKVYRARPRP